MNEQLFQDIAYPLDDGQAHDWKRLPVSFDEWPAHNVDQRWPKSDSQRAARLSFQQSHITTQSSSWRIRPGMTRDGTLQLACESLKS